MIQMAIYPELGLLDVLRTLLVVATVCFLPGLFIYASIHKANGLAGLFKRDFFETICFSLVVSIVLLALASALLTFTIGFSAPAIAIAEAALIIGCWKLWKK